MTDDPVQKLIIENQDLNSKYMAHLKRIETLLLEKVREYREDVLEDKTNETAKEVLGAVTDILLSVLLLRGEQHTPAGWTNKRDVNGLPILTGDMLLDKTDGNVYTVSWDSTYSEYALISYKVISHLMDVSENEWISTLEIISPE